jgi:hypothetical protein
MRSHRRWLLVASVAALAACGSRTGLLPATFVEDDAEPVLEAGTDAPLDRSPDVRDAALPPIDVTPPADVASQCPDAAATLVYVISESNNLYSFLPSTEAFTYIGTIECPASSGSAFSMAVSRTGTAYVVFSDGELFRVSTATAACAATSFFPGQSGFPTFGMAFSNDTGDAGETLYVAGDNDPSELARIDVTNFALTTVGAFEPPITRAELTGTGAGDLFAFWEQPDSGPSAIVQIDKANARVTASSPLPGVMQGSGWAFAFWGGDFYLFTAPGPTVTTIVQRYRPSDGSIVEVAKLDDLIVGAGVSTCAPQR